MRICVQVFVLFKIKRLSETCKCFDAMGIDLEQLDKIITFIMCIVQSQIYHTQPKVYSIQNPRAKIHVI